VTVPNAIHQYASPLSCDHSHAILANLLRMQSGMVWINYPPTPNITNEAHALHNIIFLVHVRWQHMNLNQLNAAITLAEQASVQGMHHIVSALPPLVRCTFLSPSLSVPNYLLTLYNGPYTSIHSALSRVFNHMRSVSYIISKQHVSLCFPA
jgi:hypothetical protein